MKYTEFFQSIKASINNKELVLNTDIFGVKLSEEYQPKKVLAPLNVEELVSIVKLANKYNIPLYPIGSGTQFVRGVLPFQDGVLVSMEKMVNVVEYRPDNMSIEVEAGMKVKDLQEILSKDKIFFPVNPLGNSTIGGLIATNAFDRKKYLYKTARFYVMGMEFVSPQGEIIKVGGRTIKNVSSYDLHQLLAGSWGTLGIITKITLRVKPIAEKNTLLEYFAKDTNELFNIISLILFEIKVNLASLVFEQKESGFLIQVELEGFSKTLSLQEQNIKSEYSFRETGTNLTETTAVNALIAFPLKNYLNGLSKLMEFLKQYPDVRVKGNATSGLIYLKLQDQEEIIQKIICITESCQGNFVFENVGLIKKDEGTGLSKLFKDIKNRIDPNNILVPRSRAMKE